MSKPSQKWAMPSANKGWDLWVAKKGELVVLNEGVPKSELDRSTVIALPVLAVHSELFKIPSSNTSLEDSIVKVEVENTLPGDSGEEQIETSKISDAKGSAVYLGLKIQKDERVFEERWIDSKFDWSARLYHLDNGFLFWKEWGTWVVGYYSNGEAIYCKCLGTGELAPQLEGIRAMISVGLQTKGIDSIGEQAVILSDEVELELVEAKWSGPMEVRNLKSHLAMPNNCLKWFPSYVTQLKAKRKSSYLRSLALMVLFVFVTIGILLSGYQKRHIRAEIEQHKVVVDSKRELVEDNYSHLNKWRIIAPVSNKKWVLKVYDELTSCIDRSNQVRFTKLEVREGYVLVKGESSSYDQASKVKQNLKKNNTFSEYVWSTDVPEGSNQNGYTFKYEGQILKEGENE